MGLFDTDRWGSPAWAFSPKDEARRDLGVIPAASPAFIDYFVNARHPNASDGNDGRSSDSPKLTINGALQQILTDDTGWTNALRGTRVWIYPGSYTESLDYESYNDGPNYVHLVGVSGSGLGWGVSWAPATADDPQISLGAFGWTFENIYFDCTLHTGSGGAGIVLHHLDIGSEDVAIFTTVRNCWFYGGTTGLCGIQSFGCYEVSILGCKFNFFHHASKGTAIKCSSAPYAYPYRNVIAGNIFHNNDRHLDYYANGSQVINNVFRKTGYAYTADRVAYLTGGDDNMWVGNFFEGDYSNTGGYKMGANDFAFGNFSDDTAEAEVDTTGLVIAVPAA